MMGLDTPETCRGCSTKCTEHKFVHQVVLSLHEYIDMRGQQNIKKNKKNYFCGLLAHRSGRCRNYINMLLQHYGLVASNLNTLQQEDIFCIACVRNVSITAAYTP